MPDMCPFETTNFFFQEQKIFFQGTTFVQFFMYCKAKKNFGAIRKIFKYFFVKIYFIKNVQKGGF